MTTQTSRYVTLDRLKRVTATGHRDDPTELPLRAELFVLAHDDDTGHLRTTRRTLERTLAAAVLLELWLAGRIAIGWRYNARHGVWDPDPGRITINNPEPTGDPINDTALTTLVRSGTPNITDFVRQFATTDLYERVRGDLIATGTIRRTTRRRFGFRFRETHRTADPALPFRVRAAIRDAITLFEPEQPDYRTIVQAALVAAAGLTTYLYPTGTPVHRLRQRIHTVIHNRSDTTISEITDAITSRRAATPRRTVTPRRTGTTQRDATRHAAATRG